MLKIKDKLEFKKILSGIIIFLLVATQTVTFDVNELFKKPEVKAQEPEKKVSLIAVLADKEFYTDERVQTPLMADYESSLSAETLAGRIDRYAQDIQSSVPYSKSVIILTDKESSPNQIQKTLEKLYFEGDSDPNEKNQLSGVVLVGDIPIPVVNKNNNRFLSVFPYTDFEDKTYIYNQKTEEFERNFEAINPQPEVVHGVITPPKGGDRSTLLAYFLDKNHLYYTGEEEFSEFNDSLLYSDLVHEHEGLDKTAYQNYLNYLEHADDMVYLRYNKALASELYDKSMGTFEDGDKKDNDGDGKIDEDPVNGIDDDGDGEEGSPLDGIIDGIDNDNDGEIDEDDEGEFGENKAADGIDNDGDGRIDEGIDEDDGELYLGEITDEIDEGIFDNLNDIYSKDVAEKFATTFIELFNKYFANINDFVSYSGRWEIGQNVDSLPSLISKKDMKTAYYLRAVNDLMEREVDNAVKNLQQDFTIPIKSTVSGTILLDDGSQKDLNEVTFVNHSYSSTVSAADFLSGEAPSVNENINIFGKSLTDIEDVYDCSIYRGSSNPAENSNIVEMAQTFDAKSISMPDVTEGIDPDIRLDEDKFLKKNDYEVFAGCIGSNFLNPERCFVDLALAPVFSLAGGKIAEVEEEAASFKGCYDFRELEQYNDYLSDAEQFVERIEDYSDDDPENAEENIAALFAERSIPSKHKHPGDIDLYRDDERYLTFAGALLNLDIDPNNVYDYGYQFLANPNQTSFDLTDPYPGIERVRIDVETEYSDVTIGSIFEHKEPTNETIAAQLESGSAADLPMDDPRYVSFLDKSGEYQKVVYPDSFYADSYSNFLVKVGIIEDQLTEISGVVDYSGLISSIFESEVDESELNDAITWRNMGIDDKHEYVFLKFLSDQENSYIEKPASGYEAIYVVAEGNEEALSMPVFNGDIPEVDEEPEILHPSTPSINEPEMIAEAETEEGGADDGPIIIFEWFVYIIEWLKDIADTATFTKDILACGALDDVFDDVYYDENVTQDVDGDGIPDVVLDSTNLVISVEGGADPVLAADGTDTMRIVAELQDDGGVRNFNDSYSKVELNVLTPEFGQVTSVNPMTSNRGLVNFDIVSSLQAGTLRIQAKNVETGVSSNILSIDTTNRELRVYTYTVEEYSGIVAGSQVTELNVFNRFADLIANVFVPYGYVEMLDDRYRLLVKEAEAEKPTRIVIEERESGEIQFSMFMVPDVETPVYIDDPTLDYVENFTLLNGVHIKDLQPNDNGEISQIPGNSDRYPDGVDLYWGEDRIGIVDTLGNIFLEDGYGLILDGADDTSSPNLIQVIDISGNQLFEIYIATDFENLIVSKAEGIYEGLLANLINSLNLGLPFQIVKTALATYNPLIPDSDEDGLNDLEEVLIQTNKDDPDSDADGISDEDELFSGTDPINSDEPLFTDLDADHRSFIDIINLYLRGVLKGYGDKTFKPDQNISREEFVKVNFGAVCVPCDQYNQETKDAIDEEYSKDPFPDEDINPELEYCVKNAKNLGIVSGYLGGEEEGFFLPKRNISRAEASKVLLETADLPIFDEDLANEPWYYNYVLTAQNLKIYPDNVFDEVDNFGDEDFKQFFNSQIDENGKFKSWIEGEITRAEFSEMAFNIIQTDDCLLDDEDQDGLSDLDELYRYGTDSGDEDTDNGGVKDLDEILRGSDPLDPSDDFPEDEVDLDEIEEPEEVPIDTDLDVDGDGVPDGDQDPDQDFLNNSEEVAYGTDPFDPDSDDGGVVDGDEVLMGTDPLNGDDDHEGNRYEGTGIYLIGDNLLEGDAGEGVDTLTSIIYEDEFPADNESNLFLKAEIFNEAGEIDISDSTSEVEFVLTEDGDDRAVITTEKVRVTEGRAETQIRSKTLSGKFDVSGRIVNEQVPVEPQEVYAYSLDPVKITIIPESKILKSGGLFKTPVQFILTDENNNVSNYSAYRLNISVDGPAHFDESQDENPNIEGVQVTTYEGKLSLDLYSEKEPGEVVVTADVDGFDVVADSKLNSLNDIELNVDVNEVRLIADNESTTEVTVTAVGAGGNKLDDFSAPVKFDVVDKSFGEFVDGNEQKIQDSEASTSFKVGTKAGTTQITATSPGFDPGSVDLVVDPGDVKKLSIQGDGDYLVSDPGEYMTLTVKGFDIYNNFASNSDLKIDIKISDATSDFANLSDTSSVKLSNGEAEVRLLATNLAGPINVVATADGVDSAIFSTESRKEISLQKIQELKSDFLYGEILGGPYGKVSSENYFGGEMLFNGRAQAITTLLESPTQFQKLIDISSSGKVDVLQRDQVDVSVTPSFAGGYNNLTVTDTVSGRDIAKIYIVPGEQNSLELLESLSTSPGEGIYLKKETDLADFEFNKNGDSISLLNDEIEVARFDNKGGIQIYDNDLNLTLAEDNDSKYLKLNLNEFELPIASVMFVQSFIRDVQIVEKDFDMLGGKLFPGMYLQEVYTQENIEYDMFFDGNSSNSLQGVSILDTTEVIASDQAPGFSFKSLESAATSAGVGFEGDNKSMLLFAAGNSVGESNKHYASEIGINLGDPFVSINNKQYASLSGFTQDVGKFIMASDKEVKDIIPFDYNNDTLEDLLVAYEDGEIIVLQNYEGLERFKNKGPLLKMSNGLLVARSGDLNQDGLSDIVTANKDSCKQGEVCVNVYVNENGIFRRQNLDLNISELVFDMEVADMDNNGYPDIVIADAAGYIRIFYNQSGAAQGAQEDEIEFETSGQTLGDVGITIDSLLNLNQEVLLYYNGLPQEETSEYLTISYKEEQSPESSEYGDEISGLIGTDFESVNVNYENQQISVEKDFIYLDTDPNFRNSIKQAIDLSGGILEPNDRIKYLIKLRNDSDSTITGLQVNDILPEMLALDPATIKCDNCPGEINVLPTEQSLRPFIVSGISVDPGQTVDITYEAVYVMNPDLMNKPEITVVDNIDALDQQDEYPDLLVSSTTNNSGQVRYYYSTGYSNTAGQVQYDTQLSEPPQVDSEAEDSQQEVAPSSEELLIDILDENGAVTPDEDGDGQPDGDGISDIMQVDSNGDDVPDAFEDEFDEATDYFENSMTADSDGDGLPDSWDEIPGSIEDLISEGIGVVGAVLDNAADAVEDVIKALTCSGGCFPVPVNMAFLAPGSFSVLGFPVGFDPGTPVAGWGAAPPYVCTAQLCYYVTAPSGGRFYISPTLTGGLGTSLCLGPYMAGWCFTFTIPLLQALGVCDVVNGAIEEGLAAANSAISSISSGTMVLNVAGDKGSSPSTRQETGGMSSSTFGNQTISATANTNIRIPGFPSVITDWMDRQTEEILDKLMDLPDVYFIYPELSSLVGSVKPTKTNLDDVEGFKDVLTIINSIPLLNIESETVAFKIPALTPIEIEKIKADMEQWIVDERNEIERIKEVWSCGEGVNDSICDKVLLDFEETIKSVEKNIETLEAYAKLPELILDYRNIEAKYIRQIICYLDAIMLFTGGWVKQNMRRVQQWIKMIDEIKRVIRDWKLLISLFLDYMADCDKCTSERFTLLEILLKIFVVIPSPPIIQFPKWPDIVVDISQIQTGLTIAWPDVRFRPEPIVIPSLPRLYLPDVPDINIAFPGIPVLPPPPPIPELPDLPPLPLPSLPVLPRPPKIPGLPAEIKVAIDLFKKVMKILCLIKKGLIPTPEFNLKTQVETMTARPLSPLLPIDLGLSLQFPDIKLDFYDQIKLLVQVNFQLDFDYVYVLVKEFSEVANSVVTDLTSVFNDVLATPFILLEAPTQAIEKVEEEVIPESLDLEVMNIDGVPDIESVPELDKYIALMSDEITKLEAIAADYETVANSQPDTLTMKVDYELLENDHPLLNRDIGEIKEGIALEEPYELESQHQIANLRNSLIAYVDNYENDFTSDNYHDDLNKFSSYIASIPSPVSVLNEGSKDVGLIASTSDDFMTPSYQSVEVDDSSAFDTEKEWFEDAQNQLIAQADPAGGGSGAGSGQNLSTIAEGLFIYNQEEGVNQKLIANTQDADKEAKLAYIDFDNDNDEDIIYSYGKDIYIKENYTENPQVEYPHKGDAPEVLNLEDIAPEIGSINNVKVLSDGYEEVRVRWDSPDENLDKYEIVYSENLDFVEGEDQTIKVHTKTDDPFEPMDKDISPIVDIFLTGGSGFVNGGEFEGSIEAYPGDVFEITDNNTEATVKFSDGSEISFVGNTLFDIPDLSSGSTTINFRNGEDVFIKQHYSENVLLTPGNSISTFDANIAAQFSNGNIVEIAPGSTYVVPEFDEGMAYISDISGDVYVSTAPRLLITQGKDTPVIAGDKVHTLTDAQILFTIEGEEIGLTLQKNSIFEVSGSYVGRLYMRAMEGDFEIIQESDEEKIQQVYDGMLIEYNDLFYTEDGGALINYNDGSIAQLQEKQTFIVKELDDTESPGVDLELPNGNYYSKVYSFDKEGRRSTSSETALFAPQECADTTPPYADAGVSRKTVPIFKTLEINAGSSFDADSQIVNYTLQDGDETYDNGTDPVFVVGPYDEPQLRNMTLTIQDSSGNSSSQEIEVEVIVPEIFLNPSSGAAGVIEGNVSNPSEAGVPFVLARQREVGWELLTTDSADENGRYYTDENGDYTVSDFNLTDQFVVKDPDLNTIADIDPDTGQINILDDKYTVEVYEAVPPLLPTRIVIVDENGTIILAMFMVPQVNTDVTIDSPETEYTLEFIRTLEGVHVKDVDVNDEYVLIQIPGNDLNYPGAASMKNGNDERIGLIETNGNVHLIDEGLSMRVKDGDVKDPIVIEVMFGDKVLYEIYVAVSFENDLNFIDAAEFSVPEIVAPQPFDGPRDGDNDGMTDNFELEYGLDPYDPDDAGLDYDGDGLTNLEEFKNHTDPNEADTDGDGFNDLQEIQSGFDPNNPDPSQYLDVQPSDPNYEDIIELTNRGIIEGYETDEGQEYRPDQEINRAEFTKIILKSLCLIPRPEAYEGPSVFSDVPFEGDDNPWYYDEVKESKLIGLITGYLGETDPLSGLAPFKPGTTITRAEATKIVLEALEYQGVITLEGVEADEGEAWYDPFMEVAVDLRPYLEVESSFDYVLTYNESLNPNENMTRGEFAVIANRVLDIFDCFDTDSDFDGVPDYWELENGLNPFDKTDFDDDPDSDRLINIDEYKYNTDPFDADTDDGGIGDGDEVDFGTVPSNRPEDDPIDTDDDGLTDFEETGIYGTDPDVADTDLGGMNDGDEVKRGSDPLNPSDDLDTDLDGLSDYDEENVYNTDPNDPDTDDGGVDDGTEVFRGTDPLNPDDDITTVINELGEGIYVIIEECGDGCCPFVDNLSDLEGGDVVFTAIMSPDNGEIFAKSEDVEIE